MKSPDDIRAFCERELAADLRELEDRRKGIIRSGLITGAVATAVALLIAGVMVVKGLPPFILVLAPIFGLIVGSICLSCSSSSYAKEYKRRVIAKLVAFLAPGLSYRPDYSISEGEFTLSGLFQQGIDRYSGEDLVNGTVGQTQLAFSEVHAEYKTTTRDSKGHTHTHWHTIFKGLFFIADFNKDFQGVTYVLPDTAEKLFGSFGKWLQSWGSGRGQLIKLEDPEFEKEFVVYGSDQIEARYLLSPALMERIVNLKRKTGELYMSFVGSKVYVAVPTANDLFEPGLFTAAADFSRLLEHTANLALAIGIVDDLNLNTRIWSKE